LRIAAFYLLMVAENANTDLPLYSFLHRLAIRLQICWIVKRNLPEVWLITLSVGVHSLMRES